MAAEIAILAALSQEAKSAIAAFYASTGEKQPDMTVMNCVWQSQGLGYFSVDDAFAQQALAHLLKDGVEFVGSE